MFSQVSMILSTEVVRHPPPDQVDRDQHPIKQVGRDPYPSPLISR